MFFITGDCNTVCFDCVRKEFSNIVQDFMWGSHAAVCAADINYEDNDLYCDFCDKKIESAYGDDDEVQQ